MKNTTLFLAKAISAQPGTRFLLLLALTLGWAPDAEGRSFRPAQLPNGAVFSCANCHINPGGGGPRNVFGQAVEAKTGSNNIPFWDAELAGQDADGDGFTNGSEVGDPDGDFLNLGPTSAVTNPGNANSKPNLAPGFTSTPSTAASVGVLYSYQATASDPDGHALTFSKFAGPAWISVTAGGLVSGTPPPGSAGTHPVTIRVTDNGSPPMSADQSYTLTVAAPNQPPSFTSAPLASGTEGAAYSYQAAAADPDGNPLTYSKQDGPDWLVVSTAGLVSGTPPFGAAGSHAVTLRVADNGTPALTADQSYTLIISASFTAWQNEHFDLPNEAALAAADFDADGDGLPNLVEYALRLNPRSSDARRLMNELAFNGAEQLEFSELVRDDDPKLRVVWEVAGTLPFTEPTTVEPATSDPTPDDGLRTLTFTDPLARGVVSARYGRLRFELLP